MKKAKNQQKISKKNGEIQKKNLRKFKNSEKKGAKNNPKINERVRKKKQ